MERARNGHPASAHGGMGRRSSVLCRQHTEREAGQHEADT